MKIANSTKVGTMHTVKKNARPAKKRGTLCKPTFDFFAIKIFPFSELKQ